MSSMNQYQDLNNRFDDLFEILKNLKLKIPSENILLADFSVSKDQFNYLRSICSSFARKRRLINSDLLESSWGREEHSAIICFLFAKYGEDPDDRYWDSLRSWVSYSSSNLIPIKQNEVGQDIAAFFLEQDLYLDISKNQKNMMVYSLHTHAIIPRVHASKIFHYLKDEVLHFPFEMDEDEIQDFLCAMVNEIAYFDRTIVRKESDIEHPQSIYDFPISSFYRLPKSFTHACSINNEIVIRKILPIFKRVQQVILSFDADEQEMNVDPLEWYLEEEFGKFRCGLIDEMNNLSRRLTDRSLRKAYRTPNYTLDCQSYELQVYIPEQRIVSKSRGERVFFSIIKQDGEISKIELECFITQKDELLTHEASMSVSGFSDINKYQITRDSEIIKLSTFPEAKYLIFDSARGEILSLKKSIGHDVYLVVNNECRFESDGFHLLSSSAARSYSVYYGQVEPETIFIIDEEIISPSVEQIRNCSLTREQLYPNVELRTAESEDLVVYGSLPNIHLRSKEDVSEIPDLVIMNHRRIPFSIEHKYYIADGSGDHLYDIRIDVQEYSEVTDPIIKLLVNKKYSYEFGYIEGLTYSFDRPYYSDPKKVRVNSLSFRGCDKLFTRHYQFPTRSDNTRFRIQTQDSESRLCLKYPKILCRLDKNEAIPESIHIKQLTQRHIHVDCSFKKCFLQYEYGPEKQLLLISGKRISVTKKEFSLTELRNTQSSDYGVFILFGDDDRHMNRMRLTHVYTDSTVISPLVWRYYSNSSSIRVMSHTGEFLSFSAVLDSNSSYHGKLINTQKEAEIYRFKLDSKKINQEIHISDYALNGFYQLEIFRQKKMMGKGDQQRTLFYTSEIMNLIDGVVISLDNLLHTTLDVKQTLNPKQRQHARRTHHDIRIDNFFLEITKYGETEGSYLADGYFLNNDRKIYQTSNNPYILTELSLHKHKVCFSIRDTKGMALSISEYGNVNNLNQYSPYRVSELTATILSGE